MPPSTTPSIPESWRPNDHAPPHLAS
jgi:hypothetical protein